MRRLDSSSSGPSHALMHPPSGKAFSRTFVCTILHNIDRGQPTEPLPHPVTNPRLYISCYCAKMRLDG